MWTWLSGWAWLSARHVAAFKGAAVRSVSEGVDTTPVVRALGADSVVVVAERLVAVIAGGGEGSRKTIVERLVCVVEGLVCVVEGLRYVVEGLMCLRRTRGA